MNLAIACQKAGATLVHFSTDYVFGGYAKNTPYDETDRPAPLNVYGASKVLGEYLIPDYTDRYFVLRVCGLYGTRWQQRQRRQLRRDHAEERSGRRRHSRSR